MDPIAKVALPQTSNALTNQQRAHLMRKAKKIEQLLGCPPHLVDAYDHKGMSRYGVLQTTLTPSTAASLSSRPCATPTLRPSQHSRSSIDSVSSTSTSSCGSLERDFQSSSCYPFKTWNSSSHSGYNTTTHPDLTPMPSNRTWLTKPKLSVSISDLSDVSDDSTEDECIHSTITLHSNLTSALPSLPITIPSFSIPSANSFRKAKVDRLRKRLGSGFPVDLVFPCDDNSLSSCDPIYSKPLSRIPSFRNRKAATMFQPRSNPSQSPPTKRLQSSRRPSNRVASPVLPTANVKAAKETLSLIPESPDEYTVEANEPVIASRYMKELPSLPPGITDSPPSRRAGESGNLYCGLSTLRKRAPSYRKPPPSISDDLISS